MKKTIIAAAMVSILFTTPVWADTIYPDPAEVSEQLRQEQLADEKEQAEGKIETPSQKPKTKQPAPSQPVQQQTSQPTPTEEPKQEEPKQEEPAKVEEDTDFSEILKNGVTAKVRADALEILKRQDVLAMRLSESSKILFPKEFNEQLARMDKTLVITVYDYTDKPDYQYEIKTRQLPGEDIDFRAAFDKDADGRVRYQLPIQTGTFKTWVKRNAAYSVKQQNEETVISDAKGALSIPLTAKTLTICPKQERSHVPFVTAALAFLILVAVVAGIVKSLRKEEPEDEDLIDEEEP